MVRIVIKGSLEDKLDEYLIVNNEVDFEHKFSLKDNAPQEIKDFFPKWLKEYTKPRSEWEKDIKIE